MSKKIIGIDIGGTTFSSSLFDEDLNKQLVDKCLSECKHVFVLFTLEPRCLSFFWKKFQVKTSWMDKVTVFMYYKN